MTTRPYARGLDELHSQIKRDGRRRRILAFSGMLTYYTAERLPAAYHALLAAEGRSLGRLVLDLSQVLQFDGAGIAALLEVVRDADTRSFAFFIADRPDRPAYVATGLRGRVRFLTEEDTENAP